MRFTVEQWAEIFKRRGLQIDKIAVMNSPLRAECTRMLEITEWVEKHGVAAEDIIIIDDDKSLNKLSTILKRRLVLTSPYLGLNNSSEIVKILKS